MWSSLIVYNHNFQVKLLGFKFAQLYHQIGEHQLAKEYIVSYLSVKEDCAPGHCLAGQIQEALGEKEAAVRSFERSYAIDSYQPSLVFRICSLVFADPLSLSPTNQYLQHCWLERVEILLFKLKQRLKPVVPLPSLIEVLTGEEEETLQFSDRAFLYHFVKDTKEWKEKGRGDVKILKHKISGKIRVLMRREKVLKICCNHLITPQLSLKPLQTSDRTWTWSAQDFSEGELVQETFALKFKTIDKAQKFKGVFEEAQKKSTNVNSDNVEKKEDNSIQPFSKSFAEAFKSKEGSWECQGCYFRNEASVVKCPSCETAKPGEQARLTTPSSTTTATPDASAFKCSSEENMKYGTPTLHALPFFNTSTPYAFPGTGTEFSFSSASLAAATRPLNLTDRSPNVSASSDSEHSEEETKNDNIHFESNIPLPKKIEVKTGEKNEDVVYCHRAKLFCLVEAEWKERGLGDVKILRNPITGTTR